jgi:hypothetical protein
MDYPGKVITKTQVTPTQTSASGNWTLDDQAAAIKNNNWPVALVPNPISKSLRFNSADSAYLNRTPTTPTSRKIMTFSYWVKRVSLAKYNQLWNNFSGATAYGQIIFDTSDKIEIFSRIDGSTINCVLVTTSVYRDVSAWYHIVVQIDTTQATASNRVRLYVNGTQVTSFTSSTYPAQNDDVDFQIASRSTSIGRRADGGDSTQDLSAYLTEINFIDGQALTPSSFGMTNPQTGQWIPLKYSGTYGTNGFYLNFKDATSTTTLGYDYSGNANNWTTNNFSVTAGAGNDSLTDVPTPWIAYNTTGDVGGVVRGNYCTLNPVATNTVGVATLSNGNLDFSVPNTFTGIGTISAASGKYYWEVVATSNPVGVGLKQVNVLDRYSNSIYYMGSSLASGDKYVNGTASGYGASWTTGDVIGVAVDMSAGTVTFYKNGASQGAINLSLASITEFVPSVVSGGGVTFAGNMNFGQRPFAYTPPTGFRSLCTTNLPATAIGFGLTNQGDDYFNPVLYTGTGANQSITVGFQPDFSWLKTRSGASNHVLIDSVRGVTKYLNSNTTAAEATSTDQFLSFDSNGFTLGANVGAGGSTNQNGTTYVAWNWKAGGTGVSNTAGTITSTVSANTTAGFSIVTYTGNNTTGATIGHGLGVAPSMIIIKDRLQGTGYNWNVYHASIGNTQRLFLDATSAAAAGVWNNTSPTSTVFTLTNNVAVNGTDNYVAYCFAAVPGYSAFGSYTGNNSADGPFVYTGFRPRYILFKDATNSATNWVIQDTTRFTYNLVTGGLLANTSASEYSSGYDVDILSNGFKIRRSGGDTNASGATIIYAAFAEAPFQFANAR